MALLVPDKSYLILFWKNLQVKNRNNLAFLPGLVLPPGSDGSPLVLVPWCDGGLPVVRTVDLWRRSPGFKSFILHSYCSKICSVLAPSKLKMGFKITLALQLKLACMSHMSKKCLFYFFRSYLEISLKSVQTPWGKHRAPFSTPLIMVTFKALGYCASHSKVFTVTHFTSFFNGGPFPTAFFLLLLVFLLFDW